MAKKSAAELKTEGAELGALLANARKRPMNFALLIGKEGVVLEAHPTKDPGVMRRQAKANGGGAKGTQGVMNVAGKVIELTCEDDSVPGTLGKLTKRHLKERGLAFKVAIILPSGERIGDEDGDEDDDEVTAASANEETGTDAPPQDENSDDLKAKLTERLRTLVPDVKALIAQKAPVAEKLGKGLQAVGADIASGAYERAQKMLEAIEKAASDAKAAAPVVDTDALRSQLVAEYAELSGKLGELKAKGEKAVAGKVDQLSAIFAKEVSGEDLKKAASVLALTKTFVKSELEKLADSSGNILGAIGDAVSSVVEDVKEKIEEGLEAADDFVDSLTEDGRKKLELQRLGFSEDEQDRLVAELEKNPNAIKEAKAKLVDDTKLPEAQREVLKKLADSDPKAFEAAMNALKSMDPKGEMDTSPEKMQASLEAFEVARKASVKAIADQKAADAAMVKAQKAVADAGGAVTTAQGAAAAAAKAVADFQASLPDPASMSEAERNAAVAESTRLINANEDAKKAAEKALHDQAAAIEAEARAGAAKGIADKAVGDAQGPLNAARDANEALEAKKGMMDALAFGRLSPDAKPAFKDEDKASFLSAFAKDGKLASSSMDLAARSEDPSLIAQNVGFIADKMKDGFADPSGKKLDLPPEALREMAQNSLRMGALQGEEYFKGFEEYLKSGKQLEPDPHGGLGEPLDDPDAETQRLNKIALNRTSGLGAAAIKDGKADFDSPEAKGAMDHMMFHPGSLKTFTPQMNQKMAETKGLFSDPATADKAQKVIGDTKLPAPGRSGRVSSAKIVAGTMGKKPADVTDEDAKASVLSAMMTPLSQGPVGSCFSTAPVRSIRETDPLRAMGEYSKIATTGKFKAKNGKTYPANVTPPKGENPLMRSWEYSVATAAANEKDSVEKTNLRQGMMGLGGGSRDGLRGLRDIIPESEWRSSNDPATGDLIPGVRSKLTAAINGELKFEYNAGPPVGVPAGGGGDGHSTDGGYEIRYKGKALKSQADFVAAVTAIALKATGDTATSDRGKKIVTLVGSNAFLNNVLAPYGSSVPWKPGDTAPWNMSSGGMEAQTAKVLEGGNPDNAPVTGANSGTPPKTESARTVEVLQAILTTQSTMTGDMAPLGTLGNNAAHAFNTLPNHPSLAKIKDPNSAAKIQSELLDPGAAMAAKKMSAGKAAEIFEERIRAEADGAEQDERDLLIAALKNRPTTEMTPSEVKAKVTAEMVTYRDAVAQKRSDAYIAKSEPTANNARKAVILNFFKNQVENSIKAKTDSKLMAELAPPEVVIADSNWGDPASQTLFVMSPDPSTGDLRIWKKDVYTGEMTALGKNWVDGGWDTVK